MKRNLSNSFIALMLASLLAGCDEPTSYSAESITATVVDADTRKPLEGVIVVAHWQLVSGNAGGSFQVGQLMVLEAVTDKEGRFHFLAWGPKRRTQGYLINWDPRLLIFKRGYEYQMLVNDFKGEGMWKAPIRKSKWNNQTILLKKFKGTDLEYAQHVHMLDNDLEFARYGRECEWKSTPKMLVELDGLSRYFAARNIKVDGWQVGARIRRVSDVGSQDKCGSAAAYFERMM